MLLLLLSLSLGLTPPVVPVVPIVPIAPIVVPPGTIASDSNTKTTVQANQNSFTTGGGAVVSGTTGSSAANVNGVTHIPGATLTEQSASNAAVNLQGAGAGNSAFNQVAGVATGTQAFPGDVTSAGNSHAHSAAVNAAVTAAGAGSAAANQQGGQVAPGSAQQHALGTVIGVRSQGAIRGTGTFGSNDAVVANAQQPLVLGVPGIEAVVPVAAGGLVPGVAGGAGGGGVIGGGGVVLPALPGTGGIVTQPGTGGVVIQPGTGGVITQPGTGGVVIQPGTGGVIVAPTTTRMPMMMGGGGRD